MPGTTDGGVPIPFTGRSAFRCPLGRVRLGRAERQDIEPLRGCAATCPPSHPPMAGSPEVARGLPRRWLEAHIPSRFRPAVCWSTRSLAEEGKAPAPPLSPRSPSEALRFPRHVLLRDRHSPVGPWLLKEASRVNPSQLGILYSESSKVTTGPN